MGMRGKLVIFSSPSGAGKTTLVHHLLGLPLDLQFSVSATSRPKRPGEIEGRDYHFLSNEEFIQKRDKGEFLEWEEVYKGLMYGTLRVDVERNLESGHHVIFDVDVKGALNIKRAFGDQALAIFVQPPSIEALELRLRGRGTENNETLKQRLARASMEMTYANEFDVVIVNDKLDEAIKKSEEVVKAFLNKPSQP
ncbi:MAG: guanylate kinase [Flavobacteriales bacterium]|nr:guanylate kinase [Flavobacteriales bacterium]